MGPCRTCGQPGSRGFRLPGPYSAQPTRGYAWFCTAHVSDGKAAYSAVIAARGVGPRPGESQATAPAKQADLFGA